MYPTRPAQCIPPSTVPATVRLLIVAPSMKANGATNRPVPLSAASRVRPRPSNVPQNGRVSVPATLAAATSAASLTVCPR